ncbi:MAG: BCAM0308 family protein [Balneolaceae bacterium]|jgi:NMD protein affecting ribosome stability and mRNA decay
MTKKKKGHTFKQERLRIFKEKRIDTYLERQKYPDPTICIKCGALYKEGRWTWDDLPEIAHEAVCPACQRIADDYPGGIIELKGEFLDEHKDEILNLVRNISSLEQSRHPLERLMEITDTSESIIIKTTGMHAARRIGGAIHDAYQGDIDYNYDAENYVRITWHR